MPFQGHILKLTALAALVLLLAGCETTPPKPVPTGPFLQAFLVNGIVRDLKPDENTVVIQHEDIPGYMEAMTMPFKVKNPQELKDLHPGDKVSFRMIVTATDGWLEKITVTEAAPFPAPATNEPSATAIAPVTNTLPTNAPVRIVRDVEPLNVGDLLPDYNFTNELGQAVHLAQYRGQVLAITFIFTRCPFPTFCPLMSGNFAEVQAKLKAAAAAPKDWHLLTFSFDPEYDTPATLRTYAERYHYDPAHWSFLTGALIDITAISEQFGVQFWRANPAEPISHNLRTVVVDASGRVQKIFANNNWTSDELVAAMLQEATK